jgi:hypothetical protein
VVVVETNHREYHLPNNTEGNGLGRIGRARILSGASE